MTMTMQGTIPYPPMAQARPIAELANELRQVGQSLNQTSGQITQTATTATSTWTGAAAQSFSNRMQGRSQTVAQVGRLIGQAAIPLQTLAAAITSTQAAYNTAVGCEQAARAGMPYTAAALAAAIAAEGAAVGAHQAAGAACGAAVGGIVFQIAAIEIFGERSGSIGTQTTPTTTPASQSTWGDWTTNLWEWIFGDDDQNTPATAGPLDAVPVVEPPQVDTSVMPVFTNETTEQRYDRYHAYFLANGTDVNNLADGERAIIGLRVPTNSTVNNGTGDYNDRIVVVWSENGVRHVEEFNANTEPSAQYDQELRGTTVNNQRIASRHNEGADADFDGDRDLGRLPTGTYEFEWTTNSNVAGAAGGVLRPTAPVTLERDINHDGTFNQTDRDLMEQAVTGGTARQQEALRARQVQALSDGNTIRFHPGGANNTYSAGCQTFPGGASGADWLRFRDTAMGGRGAQTQVTYVLQEVTAPAAPIAVPTPANNNRR